jgi:hypothetical protein
LIDETFFDGPTDCELLFSSQGYDDPCVIDEAFL